MKHPNQLQRVLQIAKDQVEQMLKVRASGNIEQERVVLEKYVQLVYVLE